MGAPEARRDSAGLPEAGSIVGHKRGLLVAVLRKRGMTVCRCLNSGVVQAVLKPR